MDKLVCYVDGGCDNATHSNAYGSFKIYKDDKEIEHLRFNFKQLRTSNETEYGSLITLVKFLAQNYNGDDYEYEIYTDSKLMFSQLTGGWRVLAENLKSLYKVAKSSLKEIKNYRLYWVPREEIFKRLGH